MDRGQLHIWLREQDHRALKIHAEHNDEPVASLVRRLIRQYLRSQSLDVREVNTSLDHQSPKVAGKPS
jgi:hypothetical protein